MRSPFKSKSDVLVARSMCDASLHFFAKTMLFKTRNIVWQDAPHHHTIFNALERVFRGEITRLIINIPPRYGKTESLLMFVAWCLARVPDCEFIFTSYSGRLASTNSWRAREMVRSDAFRMLYPEVVIDDSSQAKDEWRTTAGGCVYATGTEGAITGYGAGKMRRSFGGAIIIDDPLKADDARSDVVRPQKNEWFMESLQSRANNKHTPIILIAQRLHEEDMSGWMMAGGTGEQWETIVLPAIKPDGKPLWPAKHSIEDLVRMQTAAPYMFCTPKESPVLMRDLSMKPIGEIKIGDEIVGFDTSTSSKDTGKDYSRRKLVPAKVVDISRSVQPVVKMTLDSGEVLRCTVDHKWYVPKARKGRKLYAPAVVGSVLGRVCPARLNEFSDEECRLAGWLGGFFDGEGSVTLSYPNGRASRARPLITFAQGAGRNLPICEKLEDVLRHFGFDFRFLERDRSDRLSKSYVDFKSRYYYLRGKTLPLIQKFLHTAQPVKWRERLIEQALGSAFLDKLERVVSIEPDGEEEVFGLTTTTGNYVVWGLASSNSGQYMQSPSPPEGGIFKPDNIRIIDAAPKIVSRVRAWDLAASEEEGAFTAGFLLGVTENERYVIEDVVRLQGSPDQVEQAIVSTAYTDGYSTKIGLPQDPGQAGKSQLAYYTKKLAGFKIDASPESGDKITRAEPFAAQVNLGNVDMVRGEWNHALKHEMRHFPNGKYKDQIDASSRAFMVLTSRRPQMVITPEILRRAGQSPIRVSGAFR